MIVKERLLIFLKHLNIGQTAFERQVGLSNGYISKVKKSIGTQQLEKIFSTYTELDSRWLLTGIGEMLNATPKETSGANKVSDSSNINNVLTNNISGSKNKVYAPQNIESSIHPTRIDSKDIVDDKPKESYLVENELLKQMISERDNIITQKDIIIEGKDILIAEKERLISVLMK